MAQTGTARRVGWAWLFALILATALPSTLEAKGSRKGASGKPTHAKTAKAPKAPKPAATKTAHAAVPRDAKGKIQRSDAARHAFARQTGYPNGRPGYVIDHIMTVRMTWAAWKAAVVARQQAVPLTWEPSSHAQYHEMLNILPPALWLGGGFLVGEPTDGDMATGQPRFQGYLETSAGQYLASSRPMTRAELRAVITNGGL